MKTLVKHAELAVQIARRADRGEIGRIRIRFVPSADCISFLEILKAFRERAPEIQIDLRQLSGLEQVEALREGEIDMRPAAIRLATAALTSENGDVLRQLNGSAFGC